MDLKASKILRTPRRRLAAVLMVIGAITGFLLFRPDTLFTNRPISEELGDVFGPTTSNPAIVTTTSRPSATTTPQIAGTTLPVTTTLPAPTTVAGPVAVIGGALHGIKHDAEGTATIYEQAGEFVLRFEEDTDIRNGPDLVVWLLATDDYDGGDPPDYLDLGVLKGNVGSQNYRLPEKFKSDVHRVVLIWCRRFSVPFAAAELG